MRQEAVIFSPLSITSRIHPSTAPASVFKAITDDESVLRRLSMQKLIFNIPYFARDAVPQRKLMTVSFFMVLQKPRVRGHGKGVSR